jgi:hypothetical protein
MDRLLDTIILHCAATKPSMDVGVKEIKQWHLERGFSDIGYHWVIRRDGTLEKGRDESIAGAHCKNHNARSIGICLVGGLSKDNKSEDNFNKEQFDTLAELIKDIRNRYSKYTLHICGHNEYSSKDCPVFSVHKFLEDYGIDK